MEEKNVNVLFVDDDENILNALKRELIDEPYNKFFAQSGNEALKIMNEFEIAVIITDLSMPELNGLELLYSVRMNYPDTVRIILSAFTDARVILEAINTGETHRFIPKPWDSEKELIPIIKQAIKQYKDCKQKKELEKILKERDREIMELKNKIKILEDENKKLKSLIKTSE